MWSFSLGIREVAADVPQRRCAQQRVHEGVGDDICVRVAQQAEGVRDVYPA